MKVTGNQGDFKQPEPGTVKAICVQVIDLGTQESTFSGKTKKLRKVRLGWELEQLMDDGRPLMQYQTYTASIHPKSTLGGHLEAWRGRPFTEEELNGFDLGKLLGVPCMLTLVKEGDYVNVKGVAKMHKDMKPLEVQGKLTLLDLDNFSPEVFDTLPDKLREKIEKSPEYAKISGIPANAPGLDADDIPF